MFAFRDTRGPVEVGFTDRFGGVSGGPYSSLNLGFSVGDDPDAVKTNLDLAVRAFTGRDTDPPAPVLMHQVHGAAVARVPGEEPPQQVDGLVTDEPGAVLVVRVADCVPVLLADPARGVVAAAHAGRPGMVAGIVASTVTAMRELGATDLVAWLGPHVCGACYEVPEEMRAQVSAVVPEAFAETSWGTPSVDVGAGVRAQLEAAGAEVLDVRRCTVEDPGLFSYRRQGRNSGRLGGLVRVRP